MAQDRQPTTPDDEYRKQVLARYETRHKSFSKQFSILIIFGLSFLAFILVPMIAFKLEADRVAQALDEKARTIERLQKENEEFLAEQARLREEQDLLNGKLTSLVFVQGQKQEDARVARDELMEVAGGLDAIKAKTDELEDRLRPLRATEERMGKALSRFVPSERMEAFRAWFLDMADRSDEDPACAVLGASVSYFACMVERKLQTDWDQDFALIRTEVVTPLLAIEPAAAQSIKDQLVRVRAAFEARLEDNPDFWHTVDQKLVFMEKLLEEWDRAFGAIQAIATERMAEIQKAAGPLEQELARLGEERKALDGRLEGLEREQAEIAQELKTGFAQAEQFEQRQKTIEAQIKQAAQARDAVRTQLTTLEARRTEIQSELDDIEARIKAFQSPFGTLPLGLKEAALAFPFVMTAGFLVCALLLADLVGLRREYHDQMDARSPGEPAVVRRRVALVAPLWFDPLKLSWRGLGALVLFLIPVAIFFAIVRLIASGWLLQLDTEPSDRFLTQFYNGLYLLGALLLAIGLWRVAAECRTYRKAQP
jgi:DNA repair exonuclease SbcCD ATPase subunit